MHRRRHLLGRAMLLASDAAGAARGGAGEEGRSKRGAYVPSPRSRSGYSAKVMPCEITRFHPPRVTCEGDLLEGKSLRELAILAQHHLRPLRLAGLPQGVAGAFQSSPVQADPGFTYKLLSDVDRKNVHFIAVREQSFTERELRLMQGTLFARAGEVLDDVYEWKLKNGRTVRSCEEPKDPLDEEEGCTGSQCEGTESRDCRFRQEKWYRPDPKFSEDKLRPRRASSWGSSAARWAASPATPGSWRRAPGVAGPCPLRPGAAPALARDLAALAQHASTRGGAGPSNRRSSRRTSRR